MSSDNAAYIENVVNSKIREYNSRVSSDYQIDELDPDNLPSNSELKTMKETVETGLQGSMGDRNFRIELLNKLDQIAGAPPGSGSDGAYFGRREGGH